MDYVENKLQSILNVVFWVASIAEVLASLAITGGIGFLISIVIFFMGALSDDGETILVALFIGAFVLIVALVIGFLLGGIIVGCNYVIYLCLKSYIDLIKLNRTQAEKLTKLCEKSSENV